MTIVYCNLLYKSIYYYLYVKKGSVKLIDYWKMTYISQFGKRKKKRKKHYCQIRFK